MLISTIIAPTSASQTLPVQVPVPEPALDPIEQEILAILNEHGTYSLKVWTLLDLIAADLVGLVVA
jgi:hypothetical protein